MGDTLLLVEQLINGLAIGSSYALVALGFSLIFGVARLINFAQGSVFMMGAYLGWVLTNHWGVPFLAALPVVAAATAVLGALVERVAVRPLANAPAIAPLLSTIAASMVLDNAAQLIWSPQTQVFPPALPVASFEVGGIFLGTMELIIAAIATVSILAVHLYLRSARMGWALRATAQDRDAALQMGIDVDRVNMLAFALAGALGGIAGMLVGMYFSSVHPTMGFQAGLKGFTAAMLGGITSVPGALIGGLLLGVTESLVVHLFGSASRNMVSFMILIAVLAFFPNGLLGQRVNLSQAMPVSGFFAAGRRRRFPAWVVVSLLVAAVVAPLAISNNYLIQVLTIGMIYAILALSLNLVSGVAGQISLGHGAFFGIGAYACALLMRQGGFSFWLALPLAALITVAVGIPLVYPALRLQGHYVAIATLGISEVVIAAILNWVDLTRGPMGIPGIPRPEILGHVLAGVRDYYWLSLAALVLVVLLLLRMDLSHLGRTLRAVRDDEMASEALAISVGYYKTLAFGASLLIAAVAGSLYAVLLTFVGPEAFFTGTSILILTMVVLGGMGSIPGAIAGAMLLILIPEAIRPLSDARYLVFGIVLIMLIRFRPQGVLGRF